MYIKLNGILYNVYDFEIGCKCSVNFNGSTRSLVEQASNIKYANCIILNLEAMDNLEIINLSSSQVDMIQTALLKEDYVDLEKYGVVFVNKEPKNYAELTTPVVFKIPGYKGYACADNNDADDSFDLDEVFNPPVPPIFNPPVFNAPDFNTGGMQLG